MTAKKHRFLDWLMVKLEAGVGYCQGRSLYVIPSIGSVDEDLEDEDERP